MIFSNRIKNKIEKLFLIVIIFLNTAVLLYFESNKLSLGEHKRLLLKTLGIFPTLNFER